MSSGLSRGIFTSFVYDLIYELSYLFEVSHTSVSGTSLT